MENSLFVQGFFKEKYRIQWSFIPPRPFITKDVFFPVRPE
jgi:hypothetical protein